MNATQKKALVAQITAQVTAQVLAALDLDTETPAQPKADASPEKAYRSKTAKANAHAAIAKINRAYDLKLAGGSRKVSDLSAKERAAYDAEVKAVWATAPKTRTTAA